MLVEAVIGTAVFLAVLIPLMSVFNTAVTTSRDNIYKIQASLLAEEGLEVVRLLRDNGWTANIAPHSSGSTFYLSFDGTNWVSSVNNVFIDNQFERKVIFYDVNRDGSKNIVLSGGTLDSDIKHVAVFVSWKSGNATTTKILETYLTNIFKN